MKHPRKKTSPKMALDYTIHLPKSSTETPVAEEAQLRLNLCGSRALGDAHSATTFTDIDLPLNYLWWMISTHRLWEYNAAPASPAMAGHYPGF